MLGTWGQEGEQISLFPSISLQGGVKLVQLLISLHFTHSMPGEMGDI